MECPNCGDDKQRLGQHWAMSCNYPYLGDYMRSIFTGLLMGDGHVPNPTSGHAQMRIRMVNKEFLEWLDEELSFMSNGVRFVQSAEDSAEHMRKRGLRPNAKAENYSDVWELNTRTHPYFTALRRIWYVPDKQFPVDYIPFNNNVVSMWYVADGYLCKRDKHKPYSAFRLDSQSNNAQKISKRLENSGFRNTVRDGGNVIAISPNSTPDFLNWLGDTPTGFKYKWSI